MQALVVALSKYVFAKITSVAAPPAQFPLNVNSAQDISNANIFIYAIESVTAAEQAKDQLSQTLVAAAGAPSLLLTIKDKEDKLLMQNYPVQRLRTSQNSGFPVYLNDFQIDLTKTYVTLVAATSVNADEVIGFELYYDFLRNKQ